MKFILAALLAVSAFGSRCYDGFNKCGTGCGVGVGCGVGNVGLGGYGGVGGGFGGIGGFGAPTLPGGVYTTGVVSPILPTVVPSIVNPGCGFGGSLGGSFVGGPVISPPLYGGSIVGGSCIGESSIDSLIRNKIEG